MDDKNEIMVEVNGVWKKFCRDLKTSYYYGIQDLGRELVGKPMHNQLRKREFWSLQDVNFQLKRGESLGIIGPNGSGKTTLLKLLYGVIRPNLGEITLRGRVAALIELNSGMNQLLTGRENIYIIGSVLGLTQQEIAEHEEEIIKFSELGKFIDSPVKNYSSGMKIRLGFSVATNLKPDVFIIDEVLAVGDMAFVRKCQQKMSEILDSGATVIFVSHAIRHVERLCERTLFLKNSEVVACGPTAEVTAEYYRHTSQKGRESMREGAAGDDSGVVGVHADKENFRVTRVETLDGDNKPISDFKILDRLKIKLHYWSSCPRKEIQVGLSFYTLDGICVSWFSNRADGLFEVNEGEGIMVCEIPSLHLREGVYSMSAGISDQEGKLFSSERLISFNVLPDQYAYRQASASIGLVYTQAEWKLV